MTCWSLMASGLYPTPYAELLLPKVRDCLGRLDALVSSPSTFDPTTSHRRFSIICSDYIAASLLVPLIARLAEQGPTSCSNSNRFPTTVPRNSIKVRPTCLSRSRTTSILITLRNCSSRSTRWWPAGERIRSSADPLSEADVMACGHVTVAVGRTANRLRLQTDNLRIMGKSRRIEVTTGSFLAVPWIMSGTQRWHSCTNVWHAPSQRPSLSPTRPYRLTFRSMREFAQHHRARESRCWIAVAAPAAHRSQCASIRALNTFPST